MRFIISMLFALIFVRSNAQDFLPALLPWNGSSQQYMLPKNHKLATPFEKSEGLRSATEEELDNWIKEISTNPNVYYSDYGKSPQGRPIRVIKISTDANFFSGKAPSSKPVILIQAGIHAGEIDGMDAGMMLVRDISQGRLRKLLDKLNIVFIPVINPDGHARLSSNNRINQRGPVDMGWRSNSLNQNLNRDYTKLDTPELQSLMKLINEINPDLYFDIHVTDGADYQYDITYGFIASHGYSPNSSTWLKGKFNPTVDAALSEKGHIPGPLIFAKNGDNFKDGNVDYSFSPRFSHAWGDAHHTPSVLVENHSLKPFKQRVLGTYVFLEATLRLMAEKGQELRTARMADDKLRPNPVIINWKLPEIASDSMLFKGIKNHLDSSLLTGAKFTQWEGKKQDEKIPVWTSNVVDMTIARPKEYVIPVQYSELIEKLKLQGIEFQKLETAETLMVNMYRLREAEMQGKMPFQGRVRMAAKTEIIQKKEVFPVGSIRISTDQAKGTLAVLLLEPSSTDSYFQWGFFAGITERTEYFENYAMVPLSERMANSSPELRKEYIDKIKSDENFAKNEHAKLRWWFEKSEFNDDRFMLYPIGIIP